MTQPKTPPQRFLGFSLPQVLILGTGGCLAIAIIGALAALLLSNALFPSSLPASPNSATPQPAQQAQPPSAAAAQPVPSDVRPSVTATHEATKPPLPSPLPSYTPTPSITPSSTPQPVGVLQVNNWSYNITSAVLLPGSTPGRQNLILLGQLTNLGTTTSTFTAFAKVEILDSIGNRYEEEQTVSWFAEDYFNTEIPANIQAGASKYVGIGFDVLAGPGQFTIVPGDLVAAWSGDIPFTIP